MFRKVEKVLALYEKERARRAGDRVADLSPEASEARR